MGGRDGDEASLLRDANKALKRLFIPCLCTVKYFSTRGALRVGRVDKESERLSCLLWNFLFPSLAVQWGQMVLQ